MKNILTKLVCTLALAIVSLPMMAQDSSHELIISAGGGFNMLKISEMKANGETKGGIGYNIGLGYKYHFNQNLSFGTGIELSPYKAKITTAYLSDSYQIINPLEQELEYSYYMDNYEEDATATLVKIPFMLNYQTAGEGIAFYGAAGAKIGLPMSKKSKSKIAEYYTEGYSESLGQITDLPTEGFGDFTKAAQSNDFDLKMAFILSAEAGLKFPIAEKSSLYLGAYLEYGLNDIKKTNGNRFIQYNKSAPEQPIHNSLLSSKMSVYETNTELDFAEKIIPISFGVKVGISFHLGGDGYYSRSNKKTNQIRQGHMQNRESDPSLRDMQPRDIQRIVDGKEGEVFSTDNLKEIIRRMRMSSK